MIAIRRLTCCIVPMLVGVMLTLMALPSFAIAWPVQSSSEVLLAFQDTYEAEGREIVHRGVDVSAVAGEEVTSPVDGTVSFVGAVPASDTSEGQTMRGVSVAMDDGRTLTLMPLTDIPVEVGQTVAAGTVVGHVASSGDWSSAGTHLHVGLKEGRTYYDPLGLLGMPSAPAAEEELTPQEAPAITLDGEVASPAAPEFATAEPALAQEAVYAGESAVATDVLTEQAPAEAKPAVAAEGAGALVTSGGAVIDTAVPVPAAAEQGLVPSVWSPVRSWFASKAGNVAALFSDIAGAVQVPARFVAYAVMAVALAVIAIALIVLFRMRGGVSHLRRGKRPLAGQMLSHEYGRCILQKLFPAPGEAFNVPGAVQSGGGDK